MQALILAAGHGIRLHPFTYRRPKCLLKINSLSVIELMLNNLSLVGIPEILIVVGHKNKMIENKLGLKCQGMKIKYITNELNSSTNNIYSLWKAREAIAGDFLLIHGDVVCEPAVIKMIADSRIENFFAVEFRERFNDEDYKIRVKADRIIDMGKRIPIVPGARYGEAIGINRFDHAGKKLLFKTINEFIKAGRTDLFWEDAFKASLASIDLKALDISGHKWIELDFLSDFKKARKMFKNDK